MRRFAYFSAALVMLFMSYGQATVENDDIARMVSDIAAQCEENCPNDDYVRALWLHDWLINTCEYVSIDSSASPSDVFLLGCGSARQYAAAYKLLLDELDIASDIVSGEVYNDYDYNDHTWNMALMNGEWYHIDCALDEKPDGNAKREYFGLNDVQMSADHRWSDEYNKATSKPDESACNYFLRSGYVPINSTQALSSVLSDCLINKRRYIAIYYVGGNNFNISEEAYALLRDMANVVQYEAVNPNSENRTCELMFNYGTGFPNIALAQHISIHQDEITLSVGDTLTLLCSTLPTSTGMNGVTWQSDNAWIADVDSGVIKAYTTGTVKVYASCDNAVFDECKINVCAENAVILPDEQFEIFDETFAGCNDIESVWIPYGVERIGARAFASCLALKTIAIPNSVAYISDDAFENTSGFTIICEADGYPHSFAVQNCYDVQIVR